MNQLNPEHIGQHNTTSQVIIKSIWIFRILLFVLSGVELRSKFFDSDIKCDESPSKFVTNHTFPYLASALFLSQLKKLIKIELFPSLTPAGFSSSRC